MPRWNPTATQATPSLTDKQEAATPAPRTAAAPEAAAAQAEDGALAFAVRLEGPAGTRDVATAPSESSPVEPFPADAQPQPSSDNGSPEPRARDPKPEMPPPGTRVGATPELRTSAPTASSPSETAPARSAEPLMPAETKAHEPVRQLNIRIAGQGAQSAQVKLSQRGGEVVVSVRGSDQSLVESLRSGLPDLTDRLTSHEVNVDVWRPGAAPDAREHREAKDSAGPSQQHTPAERQEQQADSRRGRQPRPEWLDEFEDLAMQMRRRS